MSLALLSLHGSIKKSLTEAKQAHSEFVQRDNRTHNWAEWYAWWLKVNREDTYNMLTEQELAQALSRASELYNVCDWEEKYARFLTHLIVNL